MSEVRPAFERQGVHLVLLALLFAAAWGVSRVDGYDDRWLWISIAVAIAHQTYVVVAWRAELHHRAVSRLLGRATLPVYATGFGVLILARPVTVVELALANQGTLPLSETVGRTLVIVFAVPSLYLAYSVARYFGYLRATGADHFEAKWREVPLASEGIFRFVRNPMYVVGFLPLWMPGLWWSSKAALLSAAFQHAYIWVHYYCTELPDMRRIYGARTDGG